MRSFFRESVIFILSAITLSALVASASVMQKQHDKTSVTTPPQSTSTPTQNEQPTTQNSDTSTQNNSPVTNTADNTSPASTTDISSQSNVPVQISQPTIVPTRHREYNEGYGDD